MKATPSLMQGAILKLHKYEEEIQILEERLETEGLSDRVQDWIIMSWSLDLELARKGRETLEKWITDLNFPI